MTISNRSRRSRSSTVVPISVTQSLENYYEQHPKFRDVDTEYEGRETLNKKIRVYRGDITDLEVDAIVCPTQTDLSLSPYGLHRHVSSKAGPVYEETCRQTEYCKAGKAFLTAGYSLNAKYIIHTAGPPPDTTLSYQERLKSLQRSYRSCLKMIKKSADIKTVAFPCLGTGGGGLNLTEAVSTAVKSLRDWLEADNNTQHIDSVILVMYDESQWKEYCSQLVRIFPYGKDLAGIDLEALDGIDASVLSGMVPEGAQSTNILCYQYEQPAVRHVCKHFHSLVNTLHEQLGNCGATVERYKTSATFLVTLHRCEHMIVLHHGIDSHTIEAQVVCYSENPGSMNLEVCQNLRTEMKTYLLSKLENVTKFKVYVRCNKSTWGHLDGMLGVRKLQNNLSHSSAIQCRHKKSGTKLTHLIHPQDMLQCWTHQRLASMGSDTGPVQHDDTTGETDLGSSSSTGSSMLPSFQECPKRELKQQNVSSQDPTFHNHNIKNNQIRVPVEHEDDTCTNMNMSSHNTCNMSSITTNAQQKSFQVLTKSNKLASNTDQEPNERCSYQPVSESLHSNSSKHRNYHTPCPQNAKSASHQSTRNVDVQMSALKTRQGQRVRYSETLAGGNNQDCLVEQERSTEEDRILMEKSWNTLTLESSVVNNERAGTEAKNPTKPTDFSEKTLLDIARLVGNKETQLGLELGLTYACIQGIKTENAGDAEMQAFCILRRWKINQQGQGSLKELIDAMVVCGIDTSSLKIRLTKII